MDKKLLKDTLDHIEGLNLLLAAYRLDSRPKEKAFKLLDRTADVPARLKESLEAEEPNQWGN